MTAMVLRAGDDRQDHRPDVDAAQGRLERLAGARKVAVRGLARFPDSELLRALLAWLDEEMGWDA